MNRSRIIVLSVVAVIMLAAVVVVLRADRMAEDMAAKYIRQAADGQHIELSWSDLHIRLLHGSVRMDSLRVQLALPDSSAQHDTTYLSLTLPRVDIGRIHWLTLLKHRLVHIDRAQLTDGALLLSKHNNHTTLALDSLNLAAHDLCYNLIDSTFSYNDSVYHLHLSNLDFTSADGLFRATIGDLATADAGRIVLRNIAGGNTDNKEQHAFKIGKHEATWAQFRLSEVRTSPVNIIRLALAKQVHIDTVVVQGQQVEIYYDAQFPPKAPHPMPQQTLAAMPMPLNVGCVTATLPKMHVGVCLDGKNAGALDLTGTQARITNICNKQGSTMHVQLATHIGGGDVKVTTDLTLDKQCSLTYNADINNLKGSDLRSLTEPLVGVDLQCRFHSISTHCKGDGQQMQGDFCMTYDSLKVNLDEHGPMKDLASMAWLINPLASVVLFNRNPRFDNQQPDAFNVNVYYDPMQPFPAYYIFAVADGVLQTILPFGMGKGMVGKKKQQK